MNNALEFPKLIEKQTSQYLFQTLQKCHDFRVTRYSFFFNAIILTVFVGSVILILFLCRSQKKTPEEKRSQSIKDQKYILDKIRGLQYQRDMHLSGQMLTGIPTTTYEK